MAFLSNLKPVPRFILIGAIVAGGVYGGSLIVDRLPKKAVAPVVEAVVVPAESAQPAPAPVVAAPAIQAGQPAAAPLPAPQPSKDAGLDALMK
jgi:hypothetical protein